MKKYNMLLVLPLIAFMAGCSSKQPVTPSGDQPSGSETEPSSSEPELHPAVQITASATEFFVTKQLTLTAQATDTDSAIVWSSSDPTKATVDGGVVSAVAPGKTTITAALANDASVKDDVEITVLDTVMDSEINPTAWDYSGMYQADPVIESVSVANIDDLKTYASFKGIIGKQYVAKAHFTVKSHGSWAWNTLTIGHMNGDGVIYATGFSQGPQKLITQFSKTVGGIEQQWGPISDRSQIWNQHDLESLDITNGLDIMAVRNNGDFYFFINGELFWKEGVTFNDFDEIDTQPVIYLVGADVVASQLYASSAAADVEAVVNSAAAQKKFYPTFGANVVINDAQTSIQFKNADTITTNNKDVAAKSIGDAALMPANKEIKVEFDLVIDAWGSTDSTPVVSMDMHRYDSDPAETRSFLIGQNSISFAGWNYNSNMPGGYPAGATNYNNGTADIRMAEEKTYHVVCTRLMLDGGQDTKLQVFDGQNAIATMQHGWQDGYKGNAVVYFSVRNVNATISNIVFTVAE